MLPKKRAPFQTSVHVDIRFRETRRHSAYLEVYTTKSLRNLEVTDSAANQTEDESHLEVEEFGSWVVSITINSEKVTLKWWW
jgi:hypothetical protein